MEDACYFFFLNFIEKSLRVNILDYIISNFLIDICTKYSHMNIFSFARELNYYILYKVLLQIHLWDVVLKRDFSQGGTSSSPSSPTKYRVGLHGQVRSGFIPFYSKGNSGLPWWSSVVKTPSFQCRGNR